MKRKTNKAQINAYLRLLNDLSVDKFTNKQIHSSMENNAETAVNAAEQQTAQTAEQQAANKSFSFAKSFNKVQFTVDITDFEFCKLSELYAADHPETVYSLSGLWVNKSPLGYSPVFIVSELGKLVNMPSHLTDTAREIIADPNAVDAIENGKVGFTVYEYESHNRKCYGIRFVDVDTAK